MGVALGIGDAVDTDGVVDVVGDGVVDVVGDVVGVVDVGVSLWLVLVEGSDAGVPSFISR